MLKAQRRSGRWYSRRKTFAARREQAITRDTHDTNEANCHICRKSLLFPLKEKIHVHHWICEKWVRSFIPGADPHTLENLACVHPGCHAKATAAEKALFSGNWIGFLSQMNALGVQGHILNTALSALTYTAETRKRKNETPR